MYHKIKLFILSAFTLLALDTNAIKLTNSTPDDLLYSYRDSLNQTAILTKNILKASSSVELPAGNAKLQIYAVPKPTILRAQYPLNLQSEDLTIVTDNTFGYKFKPTAEFNRELLSEIPNFVNSISALMTTKVLPNMQAQTAQKTITNSREDVPQATLPAFRKPMQKGKRLPTRAKPYEQIAITPSSESTLILSAEEQKAKEERAKLITVSASPKTQEVKKHFLTKRKVFTALGVGAAIGTLSCMMWWWKQFKFIKA